MRFLFVSRHVPTPKQIELAAQQNVELLYAGDCDAFGDVSKFLLEADERLSPDQACRGVVCVHPRIAAVAARDSYKLGFFNNINRAPIGEKPQFDTDLFLIEEV